MKKIIAFICFSFMYFLLFGGSIQIVDVQGSKKIREFPDDAEKIYLIQECPAIKTIKGLDSFDNLKYLQIGFSDLTQLDDATWKSLKNIHVLKLDFCNIYDFSFLSFLTSLQAFSFSEGVEIKKYDNINLLENKNLELFELQMNSLNTFPILKNIPDSMRYIIFNFDVKNNNEKFENLTKNEVNLYVKECYRQWFQGYNFMEKNEYSIIKKYGL